MSKVLEPESIEVNELPTVWSPVQWEMSEEERAVEADEQATASMLFNADVPEAVLRLLLQECEMEQAFQPPEGYDRGEQGEWDYSLVTFQFKRQLRLENVERKDDYLYVEYDCGELGHWAMEITPEEFTCYRVS